MLMLASLKAKAKAKAKVKQTRPPRILYQTFLSSHLSVGHSPTARLQATEAKSQTKHTILAMLVAVICLPATQSVSQSLPVCLQVKTLPRAWPLTSSSSSSAPESSSGIWHREQLSSDTPFNASGVNNSQALCDRQTVRNTYTETETEESKSFSNANVVSNRKARDKHWRLRRENWANNNI